MKTHQKPPFQVPTTIRRGPMDGVTRRTGLSGTFTYATKFNGNEGGLVGKSRKLVNLLPVLKTASRKNEEEDEETERASLTSSRPQLSTGPIENFTDFSARMLSAPGNKLDLDPDLQAAFIDLSGGMNPFCLSAISSRRGTPGELRDRPIGSRQLPKTPVDSFEIGTTKPYRDQYEEKPFVTTFGVGSTDVDLDSYRERNRLWASRHQVTYAARKKEFRDQDRKQKKKAVKEVLHSFPDPLAGADAILRQGAKLLDESSKLQPRKADPTPTPTYVRKEPDLNYFPPSQVLIEDFRKSFYDSEGRMSLYERLEAKKDEALRKRFSDEPEPKDDELGQGWQKTGMTRPQPEQSNSDGDDDGLVDKVPFKGLRLSSLVGNRAAALQGHQGKGLDPRDTMNPLQQKMVDGLEAFPMSHFLPEGHGHRPPRLVSEIKSLRGSGSGNKQAYTARRAQLTFRDPPLGLGLGSRPRGTEALGMASFASAIHNPENDPGKRAQIEMLLDNRSLFNETEKGRRAAWSPENANRMGSLPSEWSVADFDDNVLDDFNLKEQKKQEFIKSAKLRRIRQIKAREDQARTHAFLTQPSVWQ